MLRQWQHCTERLRRLKLDPVDWKDKEGWHLTRPTFLRLMLKAHLFLDCYSILANTAFIEVRAVLP